ncbi:MAG: hypothetical protein SFY81_14095 [Verrucomicrobiota bacterium]|nr:hypothetical protein [Verrucomicrobiota bacterium]
MKLLPPPQAQQITPAVHLEFIQNQAHVADGKGLEEIENYHRSLFLHEHAAEIERAHQEVRIHQDRLTHLQQRLDQTQARLVTLDPHIPAMQDGEADVKPTAPWNFWDRTMFASAFLAILVLMVFGVLNISFNLLESGLVTFIESPVRAYFWAALLPIGALGVKVGWDCLRNARLRDIYLWSSLAVGVLAVLVWVAAYSAIYPTLSRSTAEQIESLSVFDEKQPKESGLLGMNSAGTKWVDIIAVASQAIAEIFLSAVLGMYMTTLYNRHRPVQLASNPLFTQVEKERLSLQQSVATERTALAQALGVKSRLENQLSALVAYAKSIYQKETALIRDQVHQKNVLLEQISTQLRTQLETFEQGRNGNGHGKSSLISGRSAE